MFFADRQGRGWLLLSCCLTAFPAGGLLLAGTPEVLPAHLPRYRLEVDLDVQQGKAKVVQTATWINPTNTPTDRLVFNAHSHYVVPAGEVAFMAKMLEILRVQPSDALGYALPPLEMHQVFLLQPGQSAKEIAFYFEGDTNTTLVVPLPQAVQPGQAVTVQLHWTLHLPAKQGRWGQWQGVTQLSNWLPVFAYYGPGGFGPTGRKPMPPSGVPLQTDEPGEGTLRMRANDSGEQPTWHPTPFVPWHQPFLNEAGIYEVTICLPADERVACTGAVYDCQALPNGRQRLHIRARGVRDFALICSRRFRCYEGQAAAGPGGAPVRIRVLAFEEHEFYARFMIGVAAQALKHYSKWFGAYPYPDFTVAESFFGWNGNECATLVMIDERVFAMPHVASAYVEYLLTHEVAHMWWYNLIGTNGYCETWLDEALANYYSHRLLSRHLGRPSQLINYPPRLEWLPNIRREDYRSVGMYGVLGRGDNAPIVQEIPKFGHLGNLFSLCYDKGGRIVGMIEERLQQAAFDDFMRKVALKYRYRILRTTDLRVELEQYTGQSWQKFFDDWFYGAGLSDWSIEKVSITRAPKCQKDRPFCCRLRRRLLMARGKAGDEANCGGELSDAMIPPCVGVRLQVIVSQNEECDEPTTLGFALPDHEGYPIRLQLIPGGGAYSFDDPPARVTPLPPAKKGGSRMLVDVILPVEPTQVTIDPDQVLVDSNPTNNCWHTPIRWRITPLYTFLEENDLTNYYDRWNLIFGPWLFSPTYQDSWFTRSTMLGVRAGAYRVQEFTGGVYAGYRTNFRDVVCGVDGTWDHWPWPRSQSGVILERRIAESNSGDPTAQRAVLWNRYIFHYGSSMYLPPIHFLEGFAQYSDNFLPYPTQPIPNGVRYDRTTTLGLHYRLNTMTPYWDPEGGFQVDAWYEGGVAQQPSSVGLHKLSGLFSYVQSLPPLGRWLEGMPLVKRAADWLSDSRFVFRIYGATASPAQGEFFSMGGSELFRGFDLAQRQGSEIWVGSVEWRVPLARRVDLDACDHVIRLRNAYAALFYDVGDAYINNQSVGSVAHGVGVGLRLDVAWFSFIERTTIRLDFAKAVNQDSGMQVWFGINHPF